MSDTPTVTVDKYNDGTKAKWVQETALDSSVPSGEYELHRPGGLHIDRVPCENCGGDGGVHNIEGFVENGTKCPSCVRGTIWPDWATKVLGDLGYDDYSCIELLDALRAAQTGDNEWHTNYNTGERCNCGLDPCYVNPDSEPTITGVDPDNGSG